MKAIIIIVCLSWLMPVSMQAETTVISSENDPCCVDNETVNIFLETDVLAGDENINNGWHYYIVYSDQNKEQLLNAFLPKLKKFHRHSKLPFRAVTDYWTKQYDVPIQIYVFGEKDGQADQFSISNTCADIISRAHLLGLGFLWNGTASIAEDNIKQILDVPDDYSLITSIFLYQPLDQSVTKALP